MRDNTPPIWSGEIVGKMHVCKISITALAKHLGCRREYVSRLLSGAEHRSDGYEFLAQGIEGLLSRQSSDQSELPNTSV